MGTRLIGLGLNLKDDDPSMWNLSHPDDVLAVHKRDAIAGADAILTNTFGASRCWLARFGCESQVNSINRGAVQLARTAAGPRRWVIGSIGPAAAMQPFAAAEQSAILVETGVDALILETYLAEPAAAVLREIKQTIHDAVPVLVSLREWPVRDADFRASALGLLDLGASALGVNCQADIDDAVAFATRMNSIVSCPLLVKPGVYPPGGNGSHPIQFAAAVPILLAANVRLLGGCCGTTELHVAALAALITFHGQARPSVELGAEP
jgi:methionine synthase I (cobalamin-dependent)